MAPRSTYPQVITASAWRTVYDATWNATRKRRGFEHADDGTIVPVLTNGDAVQLVLAWADAAMRSRFPLWYQFAAVAYDWSPKRDRLDATTAQRDRLYPVELGKELWLALFRLSGDLDAEGVTSPKLITDAQWNDPIALASLRSQLQLDGAGRLAVAFKIPTGFCVDKKTGRKRVARPPCDASGRGPLNPIDPTGPRLPCDKPGDCPPDTFDDPITAVKKSFGTLLIVVVVLWAVSNEYKQSRRYRRTEG